MKIRRYQRPSPGCDVLIDVWCGEAEALTWVSRWQNSYTHTVTLERPLMMTVCATQLNHDEPYPCCVMDDTNVIDSIWIVGKLVGRGTDKKRETMSNDDVIYWTQKVGLGWVEVSWMDVDEMNEKYEVNQRNEMWANRNKAEERHIDQGNNSAWWRWLWISEPMTL